MSLVGKRDVGDKPGITAQQRSVLQAADRLADCSLSAAFWPESHDWSRTLRTASMIVWYPVQRQRLEDRASRS